MANETTQLWEALVFAEAPHCSGPGGGLLGLFFSDDPDDVAMAKAICAGCPVRAQCLAGALARREPHGVWGGEELRDGGVVDAHHRRGRPSAGRRQLIASG